MMDAFSANTQANFLKPIPTSLITHHSSQHSSPAYLSLLKNPCSDGCSFASKQSSFLRGQFKTGHLLDFYSNQKHRKHSGTVVSPSCVLPLTEENVEKVLDEVRPGLMADGGNVALHEIDGLVVVLKLQGACGSCPSSTMTLKMGIETRLRDKIPEIQEVEQIVDMETGLELNAENVEKVIDNKIRHSNKLTVCFDIVLVLWIYPITSILYPTKPKKNIILLS